MLFEKKILSAYRKIAFSRAEGDPLAYYFSHTDFEGLFCEEYPFPSRHGHTLAGRLYSYENPIPGRLVVFDHGMGAGHRAYLREIEELCRHGYLVLAYDHTGCVESGGAGMRGLCSSLSDLDDCLRFVKADARFAGMSLSVIGHSWGGYASALIPALHPDLAHTVILAGAVSAKRVLASFLRGPLALYRRAALALEREANPDTVALDATELLKSTPVKVLAIYSEDDPLITWRLHGKPLSRALAGKENARLIRVTNRGHNPNYTEAAAARLAAYGKEKSAFRRAHPDASEEEKAAFRARFDWWAITEQDSAIWREILAWLDH